MSLFNGYFKLFFCLLILSLFHSCTQPSDPIEKDLLQKCIDAHGGMKVWQSQDSITYYKDIVLYLEDGSIEKSLSQFHQYSYKPNLSGTISWKDSIERKIVFDNNEAHKVNGDKAEAPDQSSYNAFQAANYVLNMPWKLMDSAAVITYKGLDTILDNQIVHTLKIEYPTGEKQDVWEYYLHRDEYYLVANMVNHGTTYSLITNDEYAEHQGLKYNAKRTSYMTDSLGNILYTRAKYVYSY